MSTTITISEEFHERLKDEKPAGESYEDYLKSQLEASGDTTDGLTDGDLEEIDRVVDQRLTDALQSHREELYSSLRR